MSRWREIRFRGVVKPEFIDVMEKAITERDWNASGDPFLIDFGDWGDSTTCYLGLHKDSEKWRWSAKHWNGDGWNNTYDKETGLWQFKTTFNMNGHGLFYVDFDDEILPYIMERVEWMETWTEPWDSGDGNGTCLQKMEPGGELEVVGWFDENGNYTAKNKERVY